MNTAQKMTALGIVLVSSAAIGIAVTWAVYSAAAVPLREFMYDYAWWIRWLPFVGALATARFLTRMRGGILLLLGVFLAAASATAIGCIAYGLSFEGWRSVALIVSGLYFGGGLLAVIGYEQRRGHM